MRTPQGLVVTLLCKFHNQATPDTVIHVVVVLLTLLFLHDALRWVGGLESASAWNQTRAQGSQHTASEHSMVGSALLVAAAGLLITPPQQLASPPVLSTAARSTSGLGGSISSSGVFPGSTELLAFVAPGLGAPKASKVNPGGAGNAEGNVRTPAIPRSCS